MEGITRETILLDMSKIISVWKELSETSQSFEKQFGKKYSDLRVETNEEMIIITDRRKFKWMFTWEGKFDSVDNIDGEQTAPSKAPEYISGAINEFLEHYKGCFKQIEGNLDILGYTYEETDFSHSCRKGKFSVDAPYWCYDLDGISIEPVKEEVV